LGGVKLSLKTNMIILKIIMWSLIISVGFILLVLAGIYLMVRSADKILGEQRYEEETKYDIIKEHKRINKELNK